MERVTEREKGDLQSTLKSTDRQIHEEGLSILLSAATEDELIRLGIGIARGSKPAMWLVAISPDEDPAERGITLAMILALKTNGLPILGSGHGGMMHWYTYPSNFIAAQRQLLPLATNESVFVWSLKL